jgi:hypothetical protein
MYKCEHCKKEFAKEKTMAVHVCEQKRRFLSINDRHVQIALRTYQRFYEINQKISNKSFEDFSTSPYYTAFVKFGSFVVNSNPIYPERFIDYVLKSGIKLDHWCRDSVYESYIVDLVKEEPADGSIQRTIQTMMDWADKNQSTWEHYFNYVNLNRAVHDIREGLISPWLLLNTKSGKEMLSKMNDEQLEIVSNVIDPPFWMKKFRTHPADLELVKDLIQEAKIS